MERLDLAQTLQADAVYQGDCRQLLPLIPHESIALSVWSPPYHVGKAYEAGESFEEWQDLLKNTIKLHFDILIPGGFLAINIADILCFPDPNMPKIMAENISRRKSKVTREDVLQAQRDHPTFNRYQLAAHLGCSEQTIDRRLNGNNIRGGKYSTQTRVNLVGGLIDKWAYEAGLFLYDRRIWHKDAAWENSRWHTISLRSVDEFEYIYIFWKPGITQVDRSKLTREEWTNWGSRAVWNFASVRSNDDHEAKFPVELPQRLIRLLTKEGDTVLDCFMGSGTTAIAAIREKRRFIGIDKVGKYVRLAQKNIEKERYSPPQQLRLLESSDNYKTKKTG
jgi:site-specific DNA-methyltransferase (adenine-specific)